MVWNLKVEKHSYVASVAPPMGGPEVGNSHPYKFAGLQQMARQFYVQIIFYVWV